jgi:uncharacterized protein DUF4340
MAVVKELAPLAVAFAVLGGLVAVRELSHGSSRGIVEEAALVPLQAREFKPDEVTRIEIAAPGAAKPSITLQKKDTSWRAVSDFTAPASGGVVLRLVELLAKAEGEFRTDDESVLEQFDLTPARAVDVRLLDKDGKDVVHVAVGRSSGQRGAFVRNLLPGGDKSKAYALVDDLRGALGLRPTSTGSHEPEKPEANHFHDKEFPQLPAGKAKHVEFVAPGRTVAFDKLKTSEKDEGAWKVAAGGPGAPEKGAGVEAALQKLGGQLHPTLLVDPAKRKEVGLETPAYRIAVTSEDGSTRAAVGAVDAANDHFYVRLEVQQDPDVIYDVSEYEFRQMFPQGSTLFDLPKLDVAKEGPTRIVVERSGGEAISMSRKGTRPANDWTLASPAWPLAAKQTALRGISSALTTLRVTDYVDGPPPQTPAEITVRYGSATTPDAELKTLSVYGAAPAGKDRLVSFGAGEHLFVIQESALTRLAPEPIAVFEAKVLHDWRREDVTAVRIGPDKALALVKQGEDWTIEKGGEKTKASKAAVEAWLDRLLKVSVTGMLPGAADFKSTPLTVERTEGDPVTFGVSVTGDGKRVVVLGDATIATVDDKDELLPDVASMAEKKAEPPKEEKPKDETPKDDHPK